MSLFQSLGKSNKSNEKVVVDQSFIPNNVPRTELQFNPEEAVINHHLTVKNVNPDIISDIDSVNEIDVGDLDSEHEKKLIATMERNQKEILERSSEEMSYYAGHSDFYSNISQKGSASQAVSSRHARQSSEQSSSDLSSVLDVEISPDASAEDLNVAVRQPASEQTFNVIRVSSKTNIAAPLNPAPVLNSTLNDSTSKPIVNTSLNDANVSSIPSKDVAKDVPKKDVPALEVLPHTPAVHEEVDIDDIPEIGMDDVKVVAKDEKVTTIKESTLPSTESKKENAKHSKFISYDEDYSDDGSDIDIMSLSSLPGLGDSKPISSTKEAIIATPAPIQTISASQVEKPLNSNPQAAESAKEKQDKSQNNQELKSNSSYSDSILDSDSSKSKKVNQEERKKYEQEILDLKNRIQRVESENHDMILKAEEKLNQYGFLESLAKNEMLNYPQKSSMLPVAIPNNASRSVQNSQTSGLAIYKQFEDFKASAESTIGELNTRLKEETSKTARFEVMKIANEDQRLEIELLKSQVKELKEKNVLVLSQLSAAEDDATKFRKIRDQGELGYVHDQKKKWNQSSENLLSNSPKFGKKNLSNPNLLSKELAATNPSSHSDAFSRGKSRDELESNFNELKTSKAAVESSFATYRTKVEQIAKKLAITKLSYEQKDDIYVDLSHLESESQLFNGIRQSLLTILENIHHTNLQHQTNIDTHNSEIQNFQARISLLESTALKDWEDYKSGKDSLTFELESVQEENKRLKKQNSVLEEANITLEKSCSDWKVEQENLKIKYLELSTKSVEKESNESILIKEKEELVIKASCQLETIEKLQKDYQGAEEQVQRWKLELDKQTSITKDLQTGMQGNIQKLKDFDSVKAQIESLQNEKNALEEQVNKLQNQSGNRNAEDKKRIEELLHENNDLISALDIMKKEISNHPVLSSPSKIEKLIEHENEVNAQISARLAEVLRELSDKEQSINDLNNAKQELENKLRLKDEQDLLVSSLKEQISRLEAQIQALEANWVKEKSQKEEKIAEANRKLEAQELQLSEKQGIEMKLKREISLIDDKLQQEISANTQLLKENEELHNKKDHQYELTTHLSENISVLSLKINEFEANDLRNKKVISELSEQIKSLEKEKDAALFTSQRLASETSKQSQKIKELENANNQVLKENEEFHSKNDHQYELTTQLSENISALTVKINELESNELSNKKTISELSQQIKSLEKEKDVALFTSQRLASETSKQSQKIKELEREKEDILDTASMHTTEKTEKFEKETKLLKSKLKEVEKSLELVEQDRDEISNGLQKAKQEKDAALQKLDLQLKKNQGLETLLQKANEDVVILNQQALENVKILSSNQSIEKEITVLMSKLEEKNKEILTLKTEGLKGDFNGKVLCLAINNVVVMNSSDSTHQNISILRNEIYRLECSVKMVERELFNEQSRFQTANLKWQETEHKNIVLQRNNEQIERELQINRQKYDFVQQEQTKFDLISQETVSRLQTKISEQRQLILDLQTSLKLNQILEVETEKASKKIEELAEENLQLRKVFSDKPEATKFDINGMRDTYVNSSMLERMQRIEIDIAKLTGAHSNPNSASAQGLEKQFAKLTRKLRREFNSDISKISKLLDRHFEHRHELDRERQVNDELVKKALFRSKK